MGEHKISFLNDSDIAFARNLQFAFDDVLLEHGFVPIDKLGNEFDVLGIDRVKRSKEPSFVQTVFQVCICLQLSKLILI